MIENIKNAKTVNGIAESLGVFTNDKTISIMNAMQKVKREMLILKIQMHIIRKMKSLQSNEMPNEDIIKLIGEKMKQIDPHFETIIEYIAYLFYGNKEQLDRSVQSKINSIKDTNIFYYYLRENKDKLTKMSTNDFTQLGYDSEVSAFIQRVAKKLLEFLNGN